LEQRVPSLQLLQSKKGSEDQAIGRSRGGLSTKIHMAVRGLGCPVRFILTAGQKGDGPQAAALIEGLSAEVVMANKTYDADHLRQAIAAKGALAVIPTTRHVRSNIRSTSISMPSAILCSAASQNSSNSAASQTLRKDRTKLPCRRHSRCHHLMDAISVHTA
jgi:transposase